MREVTIINNAQRRKHHLQVDEYCIIDMVACNPQVTREEIHEVLRIPLRTLYDKIKRLKRRGLLTADWTKLKAPKGWLMEKEVCHE